MNPITTSLATLAISTIYMVWHSYHQTHAERAQKLRERVAFMLWVMANRAA